MKLNSGYDGPFDGTRLNSQPVEKKRKFDGTYNVHSIFYTIQGEGPFAGTPATFIRLAGCNLQCPKCDTEYTNGRVDMTLPTLVSSVLENQPNGGLIVITGGEPFRQDLAELLDYFNKVLFDHFVQVETNGTLPPPAIKFNLNTSERKGSYIVCSPKTGKVNNRTWAAACCVKYVVDQDNVNREDGLPTRALGHTANPQLARPPAGWDRPIYLQPADWQDPAMNDINRGVALDACMKHGYIMQEQLHKLWELE